MHNFTCGGGALARVRARVLAGVPGAGVLDVEPMDPEDGGREPAVALAAKPRRHHQVLYDL